MPCIARWPGRIEADTVGNQVWAHWDILPTLAELAGAQAPSDLDGVSAVPALMGDDLPERDYLYWEHPRSQDLYQAARMGDWKAVRHGRSAPASCSARLALSPGLKSSRKPAAIFATASPLTFIITSALLVAAALAAAYIAGRRAAGVDPAIALRAE
ncbi:MAG: sulfatase/phosphatase domain-containing protein [Acidobacteriota bacterium]